MTIPEKNVRGGAEAATPEKIGLVRLN